MCTYLNDLEYVLLCHRKDIFKKLIHLNLDLMEKTETSKYLLIILRMIM